MGDSKINGNPDLSDLSDLSDALIFLETFFSLQGSIIKMHLAERKFPTRDAFHRITLLYWAGGGIGLTGK